MPYKPGMKTSRDLDRNPGWMVSLPLAAAGLTIVFLLLALWLDAGAASVRVI